MSLKISLIIPAWNAENTISACLLSAIKAKSSPIEIIVVDDLSQDSTVSIVHGLIKTYPRIKLLKLDKNIGPAAARNRGVEIAKGDIIFFTDSDTIILEDTFNEVKSDTANAWSLYQSTKSVLTSTQAQVNAAEIANEGITLEYESGNTRTTLEVIQSRSLLLNARISNAKAERDFVTSKFELLAVLGELTLENIKKS